MRFCSVSARSSSALISSSVLMTFGFARIAVVAASTAGAGCARTWFGSGTVASSKALINTDRRIFIATSPSSSHLHLDQPRAALGDPLRQRLDQIVGRGNRTARHAHALGQRNEIQRRAIDLQHVERALSGLAGADAVELAAQDLV